MPQFIEIDSPDHPGVTPYSGLVDPQRQHTEIQGGLSHFICEGQLVVEKLIDSAFEVLSILLTPERRELMHTALGRLPDSTPVFVAQTSVLQELAGFPFHRGVLGCGTRPTLHSSLDRVVERRLIVVCEEISNPDNIGGLFRSIAALAGDLAGVLLSSGCADPLYRKAIRVSMGHVFHVPFATVTDLPLVLGSLREKGHVLLAATPGNGAVPLSKLQGGPNVQWVLLLGAEGPGLTPSLQEMACKRVKIEMCQGVDSLNVGVAGAMFVYRVVELIKANELSIDSSV